MGEPRQFSVHLALGGGAVADILLWKKGYQSVTLLVVSTSLWFMFERAGYNLLSFIANSLFFIAVMLFLWAKSAALLHRPLPPLHNLEVSDEFVVKAADRTRVRVNHALSIARDIAIGGNMKLAFQLAIVLWVISYIGSLFNFVTLVYTGVFLSLSLPVLYDNYQNPIDKNLNAVYKVAQIQYRIIDEKVLSKISLPVGKEKKMQ